MLKPIPFNSPRSKWEYIKREMPVLADWLRAFKQAGVPIKEVKIRSNPKGFSDLRKRGEIN